MPESLRKHSYSTGNLPRIITPNFLWTGGILEVQYGQEMVNGHFSVYLVVGSEKSILIDTGHAMHWPELEESVESFLNGRPLDYVFLTHGEYPHAGLLPQWMHKYPDALAIGDIADYRLYFPEHADRIRIVRAGETVELGDRQLTFLPAIWKDLTNTLWAFEPVERILFVSDGFSYLHYHEQGQSDMYSSEMPPADEKMIQFYNERALQWTKYTDVERTFADLDMLVTTLKPTYIAPAHANLIDTKEDMIPRVKSAMTQGYAQGFQILKSPGMIKA
ncbi:MAG: MBL fold metallo-hydrolase [Rhizobiaceae bacterium]|nr:MBL fold metallo-hydrolase [Rhizobiaceae bacterium]